MRYRSQFVRIKVITPFIKFSYYKLVPLEKPDMKELK